VSSEKSIEQRATSLGLVALHVNPDSHQLHTLSRLHKSRRDSNRCSFFAGAAGGFCIPRAQQ
jgi:hypothetical protein